MYAQRTLRQAIDGLRLKYSMSCASQVSQKQSAANSKFVRLCCSLLVGLAVHSRGCIRAPYLSVAMLQNPRSFSRMASPGINFTSSSRLSKKGIENTHFNSVANSPSICTIHRQHGRLLQNRRPINRLTLCASPPPSSLPCRPSPRNQPNPWPLPLAPLDQNKLTQISSSPLRL